MIRDHCAIHLLSQGRIYEVFFELVKQEFHRYLGKPDSAREECKNLVHICDSWIRFRSMMYVAPLFG